MWPSQAGDDGDELLRAYLLAAEDYPADDVTLAVNMLVKGTAPGVNPSFRPKPSEFGAECRRQMNLRLDSENRERRLRPALPPPDIERTPESRARMKAILEAGLAKLQAVNLPENEAEAKRAKEQWDRTNARFYPDMDPDAMRQRLGFGVGEPDGERDVA